MDIQSILNGRTNTALSTKEIEFLVENEYQVTPQSPERIKKDLHALSKLDTSNLDLNDPILQETIRKTKDYKSLLSFYVKVLDDDPSNARTLYELADSYNVVETLMNLFAHISVGETYLQLAEQGSLGDVFRRGMLHIEAAYMVTSPKNRKKIIELMDDSGMLLDEIPHQILTSYSFIDHYLKNESESTKHAVFNALSDTCYSREAETDLLFAADSQYDTIEEYLAGQLLHASGDKIYRLAAVRIYVSKLLHSLGVEDQRVFINTYSVSPETQGACFKDRIELHCYSSRNLEKMIHTGAHEAHHADQSNNVKNLLLTKDNDIDIYSKEDFIREVDGTYYGRNYRMVASEYDADLKAKIDLFKLKDLQLNPFERLRKVIVAKLFRERDELKGIKHNMQYEAISTRLDANNKPHPLEDIFDAAIHQEYQEHIQNGTYRDFIRNIRIKFPIIEYEYAISENDLHRRSVEELVAQITLDSDNSEVYKYLLISYINPKKNKSAQLNRDTLEQLYLDESLPLDVRKYIRECLDNEAMDKYYARVNEGGVKHEI